MNDFIPRKFKNIETGETVDFETVVNNSNISVILGESASGKTYQLKEYSQKEFSYFIELINIEDEDEVEEDISLILLDSIDEVLIDYKNPKKLQSKLTKFIKRNRDKKIIITCRYLEWKEYFEKELKKLDDELKIYEIIALSKKEIDSLLKEEDKKDFWKFIDDNHLESLLKNIMIIFHLVENFRSYDNNSNYVNIYKKIVKEYITKIGEDREEEDTNRDLDELVLIASSLATYMILNRLSFVSSINLKKVASECYKIDGKSIIADDLTAVLKTALFEKKGDEFSFFHKSIQEYLTAYFINHKEFDSKIIKKIFSHKLKFYEEFEEVIIYLTNIQPHLFDNFVDFDPFIFRRHPSLSKEQQEKLLLSILKRLQNNEAFAWDKKAFFYNTSLVKFNDIDVYSIIKDKNIEKSQNDILLQYIMRLFAENYAQEFENYIFEILSQNLHDKIKCSKLIGYSYNIDYRYNLTLFNFMENNQLFSIDDNSIIYNIGININSYIIERLFLVLYGFKFQHNNHSQIIERDDKDYDVEKVVDLIPFINYKSFVEITSSRISIEDLKTLFELILKTYKYKFNFSYHNNVGLILYKILDGYRLSKGELLEIIVFVQKSKISSKALSFQKYTQLPNDFFEIYFSDKIQDFSEISHFISFYMIKKIDIEEMQKKYPFEDNFFKTFQLLEYLNRQQDNEEFLVLDEEQLEKIVSKLKCMEQNEELAKAIFTLFSFNYSQELEGLVFQILEKYTNDIKKCREYIEKTLVSNYTYNIKLFNFMKKYKLFMVEKYEIVSFDAKNEIENWLFNGLYGLWFKNKKPRLEKNDYKEEDILFLFEYISYYHFFDISEYIDIEDIEKWFYYFYEYYNSELLKNNSDYKDSIGWITYKLLIDNKLQSIPLEEIMKFFQDTNLHVNFTPSKNVLSNDLKDTSPKPLFYTIKNEFWSIYFSDKIKSFEEIKNFISLYKIDKKDLEEAIEKYSIEDNIEKYYSLGVQYNFIDVLMENEIYKKYVEYKENNKESLDGDEKEYLKKIDKLKKEKQYYIDIQNVNEENFEDIFYYAVEENNDLRKTDNKLRDDLKDKYDIFISEVVKSYTLLEKEYIDECHPDNQWIYNYLFNILSTQEEINNILVTDENYRKLFWYIVLGCISTRNDVLFNVIEEKFDLFLEVFEEFIEKILKKENTNCFDKNMQNEWKDSPCSQVIDIFKRIEFDKEQKIWVNFLKNIEKYKEKNFQYKKFFKLILNLNKEPKTIETSLVGIQKNNKESFTHFTFVFKEDINLALEYFYKYIYDSIPDVNEEKHIELFDKLLDEIYIKRILIDYYKFFEEEKIPLANDYYEGYRVNFNLRTSSKYHLIIKLWGLLQSDKKYKTLLKGLKKSDNKNISDSAEYCLLKLYEKQGEERCFDNNYYKEILDNGLLPIASSSDLFDVVKEIWDKDIRTWIESEGAYKFINELAKKEQNTNAEDFIQKTIISEIKLGFSERGYKKRNYFIKREEQLLDDKRLDFTISYPPFGSIVIELKLAHNDEVKFKQNNEATKKAEEYISKLKQYIKGSNSDFALFVIFNVKEDQSQEFFNEQIDKLKELYKEHNDIDIIGLNCKNGNEK